MNLYNPFSKTQRRAKRADAKLAELSQFKAVTLYQQYTQAILHSNDSGVGNTLNDEIIVSLTSFNERLDNVAYTIESMMQQTLKADRIQLWLGADKVSASDIPLNLRLLEKRGLEICFGKQDLGPYTKFYYALEQNPQSLLITVDDDIFYPPDTIEKLYRAYQHEPTVIHCHRGHKMIKQNGQLLSYRDWEFSSPDKNASLFIFPTGVGGVLYFPKALNEKVFDSQLFLALCPNADDVWLKAMSLLENTPCKTIASTVPFSYGFPNLPYSQVVTLKRNNKKTGGNDSKISRVFDYFSLGEKL